MARLSLAGAAAVKKREQLRTEFWPTDIPWSGPEEVGYFCGPRSLPYVLQALRAKGVSGSKDPGPAYLELLSRHIGQGVVEMTHEEEHSHAAGYSSSKTWRDRMKILESAGFIKPFSGGRRYARVFLVHPSIAMNGLWVNRRITKELWEAYRARQIEAREPSLDDLTRARATKALK
jgi:hypothetical protein